MTACPFPCTSSTKNGIARITVYITRLLSRTVRRRRRVRAVPEQLPLSDRRLRGQLPLYEDECYDRQRNDHADQEQAAMRPFQAV